MNRDGNRRIFQNHENRIPCKTCISFQRRQNTGTLSDLLSFTDDLSDTGKEAGRKIHSRRDHNDTEKMDLHTIPGTGYQPSYTRTDLTDELHEIFGFNTDYQIMTKSSIRNIIKLTKQRQ